MNSESSGASGSNEPEAGQDNERLALAIVAGDRTAEHVFALRFMRPVKAMLTARLRNSDLAADLLQEVMIEAICALRRGQLREPSKLPGFVAAVARNVLNNYFRKVARQPEPLEFPEAVPDLSLGSAQKDKQEREALALKAISSLDSLDKTILQMTLVDGLKPGAIAEKLRLSPDLVRQRKLRATRRVIDFVQNLSQTNSGVHLITGRRT